MPHFVEKEEFAKEREKTIQKTVGYPPIDGYIETLMRNVLKKVISEKKQVNE